MAVVAMSVDLAVRLGLRIPLQIINDNQIEQTVIIYVHPRSRDGPERPILCVRFVQSCFGGDIRECSIPIIVIKSVVIDASYKNIFVTIVVIVSDGHAHIKTSSG